MPNIILQDLTAIINGTSKYGAGSDTVHVETFITTDSPIPPEMNWFVPNSSVPNEVLNFFKINKLDMYPMTEKTLLTGTEDIIAESQNNDLQAVEADSAKLMLRAVMKKSNLAPIVGTNNCYIVSYDYKIYPQTDGSFDFKVVLPFDGLTMINQQSHVYITVTTPFGCKIDEIATKGANPSDPSGVEIVKETITMIPNTARPIVSFEYHQDPIFTIKYRY